MIGLCAWHEIEKPVAFHMFLSPLLSIFHTQSHNLLLNFIVAACDWTTSLSRVSLGKIDNIFCTQVPHEQVLDV